MVGQGQWKNFLSLGIHIHASSSRSLVDPRPRTFGFDKFTIFAGAVCAVRSRSTSWPMSRTVTSITETLPPSQRKRG